MKKGKMFLGSLSLFVAIGAAYAFNSVDALPGNLYYFNDLGDCVKAPCETQNNTGNPCLNTVYSDAACQRLYTLPAWTTEGGN